MQALAQNATDLAISSTQSDIDLKALVESVAVQSVTGITLERVTLNNGKLMQAARLKYKGLRNITGRLQDEVENTIQQLVNEYITSQVNRVHQGNGSTLRVFPRADFAHNRIVERVQVIGDNLKPLDWQFNNCVIMIRASKERLVKVETTEFNLEQVNALKKRIANLDGVKAKIKEAMKDGNIAIPTEENS